MTRRTGVVMPVRAFRTAHTRLADQLDPSQRSDLARRLAERVVAAARTLPVVVVTSAPEVRDWAAEHGVDTIDDPGSLDAAAAVGRAWHREHGCTRIIVAHADLPRARSLAPLARDGARPIVAIVPCHRDDGTPVMSLPADVDFDFHYGAGSFRLHVAEARRRGLGVRVIRDPDLGFDIDTPDDLERLDEEPAR
jgi:2-phospho-L-lactate guanylyltransferase